MEKAFLKIVNDHQGIIYKVCKMYRDSMPEQEDLYQEIVLQLWRAYPHFRNESKVSTWMYRIALNTAIALFRKNKVTLEYNEDLPKSSYAGNGEESSENEERMFEAIRRLNNAERAIVALFLDGHSYSEIAAVTGITENHVAVKITRIKEKLKNILN